jgi:hypothetical protein
MKKQTHVPASSASVIADTPPSSSSFNVQEASSQLPAAKPKRMIEETPVSSDVEDSSVVFFRFVFMELTFSCSLMKKKTFQLLPE